jgi:hypothetical protein
MHLKTAIACLHYDDFLAQTLPHNLPFLDSVTILTSPRDPATIQLAKRLGMDVFITDAWHAGGPLNKAHALNQWIAHARATEPDAWLMTLDADMLLFGSVAACLATGLDPRCLYSIPRRLCPDESSLSDFFAGRKPLAAFPLDTIPVVDGKLWGQVPQANTAGLSGYFQMWCPAHSAGPALLPVSGTAEGYDVFFGLLFPEDTRRLLPLQDALHLGPREINWSGRRSPRWQLVPNPSLPLAPTELGSLP